MCVYQDAAADKPDEERKGICKAGECINYDLNQYQAGAMNDFISLVSQ